MNRTVPICLRGLVAACALAGAAHAQLVGGSWELLRRVDGEASQDAFGAALAAAGDVDGDGFGDFIVGARFADPNANPNAGSAYVYSGATGALLHRFDGNGGDLLGVSVGGAGDVDGDGRDDLIVGAFLADPGGRQDAGSAFVYSGASGAVLHRFDGPVAGDTLGRSVAGAGDVDADGVPDLVVGAELAAPNGILQAGSVFVYSGATGALLHRFDGGVGSGFGTFLGAAVDGAGDVDGDGHADLIVGARNAAPGGVHGAGEARVYSGADGSLLHVFAGTGLNHSMGYAVAGAGDVDRDGRGDLLVSAPFVSVGGVSGAGSVYLYSGASGALLQRYDGQAADEHLGWSVAGAADVDGDGVPDQVMSAPAAEPGGVYLAGSCFVRSGATGVLLRRFDGTLGDELGSAVGLCPDSDGDGLAEVLAGAVGYDPPGTPQSGSTFAFSVVPYLVPDADALSASGGGALQFAIDFPASEAFVHYALLASLTGRGPTTVAGLQIPLTQDALFARIASGAVPVALQGALGLLDSDGDALATLHALPSLAPAIGLEVHFAAVSFDLAPLVGRTASVARTVRILP